MRNWTALATAAGVFPVAISMGVLFSVVVVRMSTPMSGARGFCFSSRSWLSLMGMGSLSDLMAVCWVGVPMIISLSVVFTSAMVLMRRVLRRR